MENRLHKVPIEQLKQRCPEELFGFKTTQEVSPLAGIIGQERAIRAVEFGLNVKSKGYNIYIAGEPGTGRTSYTKSIIGRKCLEDPCPVDWCYVYNFKQPENPVAMSLPPGTGQVFVKDMENLVAEIKEDVPKAFGSEDYDKSKAKIMENYQLESAKRLGELEQYTRQEGFVLRRTGKSIVTVPVYEDKPLELSDYANLPEETRKAIRAKAVNVESRIEETMRKVRALELEARKQLEAADKELGLATMKPSFDSLRHKYEKHREVVNYLDEAQDDMLGNIGMFLPKEEKATPLVMFQPPERDFLLRYQVNLFVNNEDTQGAPVIWETNPTYYNLFGKIEGISQLGAVTTNFTMVKSGSVHRANGGYLIVQAEDILKDALAWDTLKRTLQNKEAAVENIGERFRIMPTVTLKPNPIPIEVKVILIGSVPIYHLLHTLDKDFRELFKIKAQFDSTMERSDENIKKYVEFICTVCAREGLKHFEAPAVAEVVEHSCRLAEEKGKLSTRFNSIVELLYEANAWAQTDDSPFVTAAHVDKAIQEKILRSNLPEEKVQEHINSGNILVDVEGEIVGQVNGLSVVNLGDYVFGQPSRITARTFLGEKGIINIEREAKMSGNIHDKGVLILSGYLGGKYAVDKPLTLSGSICFEQSYGGVDGDSATCAELVALLSAIAEIPVKQGLAMTGSLNQRGEVQPIGGINEKIEGFHKTCDRRGLTGNQGVVVPHQNVKNLMLSNEVIESVRRNEFHIYAIKTIDDAIELMTGVPADEFHKKVDTNLEKLARTAEDFSFFGGAKR